MINLKNQKLNQIKLIQILFCTFPISFIAGNLLLSIHLVIFVISSIFYIKKENITFKLEKAHWLLIIFFIYTFLITTIQFQAPGFLQGKNINWVESWPFESKPIFKSFILIRYLILALVVHVLFTQKILDLKKLFLVSLICSSFVSLDVIFQYYNGVDIFNFKGAVDRNSGPFGDENIAGSFLQKFSFLSIFGFLALYNKKHKNIFLIFIIVLHAYALLISGNRMPLILFFLGIFLLFIIEKKIRTVLFLSMIVFAGLFLGLLKTNEHYYTTYTTFFAEINPIKQFKINENKNEKNKVSSKKEINQESASVLRGSGHRSIFKTSIVIWKQQPLFGYGLKSFRIKCWEILEKTKNPNLSCATHSHNYYLELLSEVGIIGCFLMIVLFIIILKNSFLYLKEFNKSKNLEIYMLIPLIIVLFIEFWPIKSSGSFFTTWNATFLWLYAPFILTFKKS